MADWTGLQTEWLKRALLETAMKAVPAEFLEDGEPPDEERIKADKQLERELIEAACWVAAQRNWGVAIYRDTDDRFIRAEPHQYVPPKQAYVMRVDGPLK